jgi:hypothetical protein
LLSPQRIEEGKSLLCISCDNDSSDGVEAIGKIIMRGEVYKRIVVSDFLVFVLGGQVVQSALLTERSDISLSSPSVL